jgi:protein-glucosylgalactosylhydroxylysine glucosidase
VYSIDDRQSRTSLDTMQERVFAPLLLAWVVAACSPPSEWLGEIEQANMLFACDESGVQLFPVIGNGYLATNVNSQDLYLSGVFNGFSSDTPSHRARLQSPANTHVEGATVIAAALNILQGTYVRRYLVPYSPDCSAGSSCSTEPSGSVVQVTFLAHRVRRQVVATLVELLEPRGQVFLSLSTDPGPASSDVALETVPGFPPSMFALNGSTLVPETNDSSVTAVAVVGYTLPAAMQLNDSSPSHLTVVAYATALDAMDALLLEREVNASTVARRRLANPTELIDSALEAVVGAVGDWQNGTLLSSHAQAWGALWSGGIEFQGRSDLQKASNASMYAILSTVREDRPYSLSPGGLGTNGYNGHTFWDACSFMSPPVTYFHPDIGFSLATYRVARLAGAQDKAASYHAGYRGALFPWESAFTGEEVCPSWAATGQREIHINGDLAKFLWQLWKLTGGDDGTDSWLSQAALPVLGNMSEYWLSKAVADTARREGIAPADVDPATTLLHVDDVIPPDEYEDHVNDSVYTNAGARMTLEYAVAIAQQLNLSSAEWGQWAAAAPNFVMEWNSTFQFHPEFAGYANQEIKQADVVLLGYPLDIAFNLTPAVRANDLNWYGPLTDNNGPAMTWSMMHIGYVEVQDWDRAASNLNRSFSNMHEPFWVWTETPTGGTEGFITGAGGALQGFANGYPGLRIREDGLDLLPVRLPEGVDLVRLRGLTYLGNRFSVEMSLGQGGTLRVVPSAASVVVRGRVISPQPLQVCWAPPQQVPHTASSSAALFQTDQTKCVPLSPAGGAVAVPFGNAVRIQ